MPSNVAEDSLIRLTVFTNGVQLDETIRIVSVDTSKALNKISTASLVVLDGDMPGKDFPISNAAHFKPGNEIQIKAGYDEDEATIFQGVIVKHGIRITGNNYSRLVIECRDKAVGMTIGRRNATYLDSKDSDIIAKLISQYSGISSDVTPSQTTYKELVQYYCTDWDFLLSRAEVNGMVVIVDDGKVTVQPPQTTETPVLTVTYGEGLMEFEADVEARTQLTSVKGIAWNLQNQAVVEEEVTPQALNAQGDIDSAALARVVGPQSFRLQTTVPMEQTALKAWAHGQQVKAGLARIRGYMKFQGNAKAKIGGLIELEGVGNRFNGNVFVSAVHHEIANGNWITTVEFGMSPDWFAEQRDLVSPSASGLLPGVEGLQIGVVTALHEDPDGEHKIQVTVPVLQAEPEGVWARLASWYGSDGIGAFFIPEIGDEVVLGYLNNDPCHPVILGSLYSSKRKPPYDLTAENSIKAIVTKSKLRLEFDDEKKTITIVTPGKNTVVVSDEDQSLLLKDQHGNTVKLNSEGILLDSPKDIALSAKGKFTLNAVGNVSLNSKADMTLAGLNINQSANVGFVAKGNASAELSASGQTTVKGAMVMIN